MLKPGGADRLSTGTFLVDPVWDQSNWVTSDSCPALGRDLS